MARLTVETAREMAARSVAARRAAAIERDALPPITPPSAGESVGIDPAYARELGRECWRILRSLHASTDPRRASLWARCLRDAQACWQDITGTPRAGLRKDSGRNKVVWPVLGSENF